MYRYHEMKWVQRKRKKRKEERKKDGKLRKHNIQILLLKVVALDCFSIDYKTNVFSELFD